jgi:cell wall-associated NlpC family hydrolase
MNRKALYLVLFAGWLAGCSTLERPAEPFSPAAPASAVLPDRSEALLQALFALGVDYENGGASPVSGFDCSGLVAHVYLQAYGIGLPRTAREQSEHGTAVEARDLQPGDLVFYDTLGAPYSHVGIYLGEGRFVHAPREGAQVRIERMQAPYWTRRFNGARRIGI